MKECIQKNVLGNVNNNILDECKIGSTSGFETENFWKSSKLVIGSLYAEPRNSSPFLSSNFQTLVKAALSLMTQQTRFKKKSLTFHFMTKTNTDILQSIINSHN